MDQEHTHDFHKQMKIEDHSHSFCKYPVFLLMTLQLFSFLSLLFAAPLFLQYSLIVDTDHMSTFKQQLATLLADYYLEEFIISHKVASMFEYYNPLYSYVVNVLLI